MIFADPKNDSPIPNDSKVFTFKASSTPYTQSSHYDRYTIPNDVDVVVIEDGAMIIGTVHTDKNRTKPLLLTGRGVIMGKGNVVHGTSGIPYNALVITKGDDHVVENIMVINSRHFGIDVGDNATLDNAKMYGYDTNNDGVVGGDNSKILNTFFKVNDDHIKLYNNGMIVRGATFWGQTNGGILQFGWFGQGGADDILVEDSEVIANGIGYCGDPALGNGGIARTFMSIQNQDKNENSRSNNVLIRDVIIQGQLKRLVGLNGNYLNSKPIEFKNTRLENIEVINKPSQQSWIYTRNGSSPYEVNLDFKNVKLGGACLTKEEFKTEGNVNVTTLCNANSSSSMASSSSVSSSSSSEIKIVDISDLKASVFNNNSVKLQWSRIANTEAYRIRRKTITENIYRNIGGVDANTLSFVDQTLLLNVEYQYMVRPLLNNAAVAISNVENIKISSQIFSSSYDSEPKYRTL